MLESLFPCVVAAREMAIQAQADWLLPQERADLGAAVPKRIAEFACGRRCAREAMRAWGVSGDLPLLRGPHREPLWPAGLLGSITHTDDYCAAVVAPSHACAGLGIDAERRGHVEVALWPLLFGAAELAALQNLDPSNAATLATVLFSAKEAFFKSQFALTSLMPDFASVGLQTLGPLAECGELVVSHVNEDRLSDIAGRMTLHYAIQDTQVLVGAMVNAVRPRSSN